MQYDDPDVTIEEIGAGRLRVTIDDDPIEVTVVSEYSTHHHFGRFSSLDQLVEVIREQRRTQGGHDGGHDPTEQEVDG